MKLHPNELPYGKKQNLQTNPNIVFFLGLPSILLTVVPLYYASCILRSSYQLPPALSSSSGVIVDSRAAKMEEKCDISKGEWIPDTGAPYYTNETCSAIYDHQNCLKYGRPDMEFLRWRWKPDGCELPVFDPFQFLELVRGKSLAFVGDSVGRNQMQSLMCLLSKVESPVDITSSKNQQSTQWKYTSHNFTIANFWSPFLVKASEANSTISLFNLYLDEFDESWTTKIDVFDYVVISGGHWFFRPSMLFEGTQLTGCHYCPDNNVTVINDAPRKAFRTAFRAMNSLKNFKGITFLRTFAPSHFEYGQWNNGGNCSRTKPVMRNETRLADNHLDIYKAQMEEFQVAEKERTEKGLKFRLLDTTEAMLLRPDGHPSRYGRPANVNWANDCLHWCLPGPIDTMNIFLFQMLKYESEG